MTRDALLVLEDGTHFSGTAFAGEGTSFGEAVFNTGMSGYQEVLTDPSYRRQVVTMTAAHIGNYGANDEDRESDAVQVAAFVVREAARRPSNWRSERTLAEELDAAGVIGIQGIDTRRLTRHLRSRGAMRCAVSTDTLDVAALREQVLASPEMVGADLAREVTTATPYELAPDGEARFRVAAIDFGIKRNISRLLVDRGCHVTVLPAATTAEEILAMQVDGVFLSNGPGDPAAVTYGVETTRALLGELPIFGICLGSQLLGRALGAETFKLPFGHRGINQPVLRREDGVVEISSHNHGFAVDPTTLGDEVDEHTYATAEHGRVEVTHVNLNDRTCEGVACLDVPAFAVQYHPEAAPGPHDSRYLFDRFAALMTAGHDNEEGTNRG